MARAFLDWACVAAVCLDDFGDGGLDVERLAFLDEALEGRRIVYLGEPSHWIHEKYPYRLLMLRYLFSRGWRHLGEELSWSDGRRVDHYLDTGESAQLDRITAYGYEGANRPDRDDRATGLLAEGSSFPTDLFRSEQVRFAHALRRMSESRPPGSDRLHFFGFDADYIPGAGYEHIDELLLGHENSAPVTDMRALLARVEGETIQVESVRVGAALEWLKENRDGVDDAIGSDAEERLRYTLLNLRESLDYVAMANPATDWETLRQAMAKREQIMHRHVSQVLSTLGPEEKLILMAHNQHLAKDDDGISAPQVGAGPGGGIVPSVGCYLNRLFPGEVFSIWMLWERGADCQPYPRLSNKLGSPLTSLNAVLADVGPVFILPTHSPDPRSQLLSGETEIASMYNQVLRATLADQCDAIFFVREVSPLASTEG
ncbi:MAG TPA: erythromycin esterase family protein [Acidobacteriota bacterium]|nr:erythromycin esterase family protein [Acidobacteriota bacterium]